MNPTAIKASPPPAPSPATVPSPTAAPSIKKERGWAYKGLEVCASLRITVVLFVLAFILVFYGTWAQVDHGIWTIVNKYFRSFFVLIPLKVILLRTIDETSPLSSILIPYPGGWLLGGLLLVNLLAAHAMRFKLTWKRSGILMIHAGIILMMLGEFVTGVFAIEGRMSIPVGFVANYVEADRLCELAIVERVNPKKDDEVKIPDSLLARGGTIKNDLLPFDVEVVRYMKNSVLRNLNQIDDPNFTNPASAGIGTYRVAIERPETVGVDTEQGIEIISAYVKLTNKTSGADLGTYLVSTQFAFLERPAEEVLVDGKKYRISLRPKRSYRPFTMHLKEFHHEFYPGTDKPRNYQSDIRLIDPERQVDRDLKIYMNHPLRHRGETFYQSALNPLARGTVLQVVRNPGWLLPYVSCAVVTLGMLVHFGMMLLEFLRRKLA